jgi:hypothetical protein
MRRATAEIKTHLSNPDLLLKKNHYVGSESPLLNSWLQYSGRFRAARSGFAASLFSADNRSDFSGLPAFSCNTFQRIACFFGTARTQLFYPGCQHFAPEEERSIEQAHEAQFDRIHLQGHERHKAKSYFLATLISLAFFSPIQFVFCNGLEPNDNFFNFDTQLPENASRTRYHARRVFLVMTKAPELPR